MLVDDDGDEVGGDDPRLRSWRAARSPRRGESGRDGSASPRASRAARGSRGHCDRPVRIGGRHDRRAADTESPDGTPASRHHGRQPDATPTAARAPGPGTRSIVTEQEDAMPQQGRSTPPEHIRVVVADDHPMWRDAVARDLADAGFEVVATADDGRARRGPDEGHRAGRARPRPQPARPHRAEVCAALAAARVPTRILILSASGDQQDVLDAVKAGALGYLVKSAGREEFLAAVRATAAGEPVFTPGLAGLVLGEFRRVKAAARRAELATASGARADRPRDRDPQVRRDGHGLQGDRERRSSSRTARSRTTCRTSSASCRCTTASSSSGSRWSAASTRSTRPEPTGPARRVRAAHVAGTRRARRFRDADPGGSTARMATTLTWVNMRTVTADAGLETR